MVECYNCGAPCEDMGGGVGLCMTCLRQKVHEDYDAFTASDDIFSGNYVLGVSEQARLDNAISIRLNIINEAQNKIENMKNRISSDCK